MNKITKFNKLQIIKLLFNIQKIIIKNIYSYNSELNDYFYKNLGGFCLNSSYLIFKTLKKNGFNPKIIINEEHSFILCDGYIIDISAYQFNSKLENYPKINLGTYNYYFNKFEQPTFWNIENKFTNLNNCKKYCKENMFYKDYSIPFYLKELNNNSFNNIEYEVDKIKII